MDPSVYIPAYLERAYLASHPELTDAARNLVHNAAATSALISMRRPSMPRRCCPMPVSTATCSTSSIASRTVGSDEEFEQTRNRLFDDMRDELLKIVRVDALAVDAQLLAIILADTPVDACLGDLMKLEATTADYLQQSVPGFEMEPCTTGRYVLADGVTAADLTVSEPALIGWLHTLEAISQLCMASARYRAAANYARRVLKAEGYPTRAAGTVLLALARLEDQDGFFALADQLEEQVGADALENPLVPARPQSSCSKRTRCVRRCVRCVSSLTAARAAHSSC